MRPLVTGILRKLGVFLLWNLVSVGVLFLPVHPLIMFALELLVVVAFARRYLLPRRVAAANPTRPPLGREELGRRATLRLRGIPRDAWGAVAAWIAATLVLDQLVTLVYFHLVPRAADYPDPLPDLLHRPLGWLPLFLAMLVAAPLLEETTFRGWVQRPLERRAGVGWAIAISALLFALAHGLPLLIPYYLVAGVVLGVSVYLTRSLWVGMIAHAAHNLSSVSGDALGLTNEAAIAWTRRPAVFALAVLGLLLWSALMVWLGRRLRAATRRSRGGHLARRPAATVPAAGA